MKKSIIKKNQIAYEGQKQIKTSKDAEGNFKLELKIPREKLKKELSVLKKEMMGDVEELQHKISIENEQLKKNKLNFQDEKKQAMDELSLLKQSALQKGHKEGCETGKKEGYDVGFKDGHKKGQEEFDLIKSEYVKHTKELFQKMEELNSYKAKMFEKAEPEILKILDEIVKKVVTSEMTINPELSLAVIRDALQKMNDVYKVKLKVNPKHMSFISENKDRLIREIGGINSLDISQDNSIHEGGCVIETDYGLIDAKIETKMISIMELLNVTYESRNVQRNTADDNSDDNEGKLVEDEEDLFGAVDNKDNLVAETAKGVDDEDLNFLTDDDDDEADLFPDDDIEDDQDDDLLGDI